MTSPEYLPVIQVKRWVEISTVCFHTCSKCYRILAAVSSFWCESINAVQGLWDRLFILELKWKGWVLGGCKLLGRGGEKMAYKAEAGAMLSLPFYWILMQSGTSLYKKKECAQHLNCMQNVLPLGYTKFGLLGKWVKFRLKSGWKFNFLCLHMWHISNK